MMNLRWMVHRSHSFFDFIQLPFISLGILGIKNPQTQLGVGVLVLPTYHPAQG
ncbi:hypothetical protein [Legionella pneumophila]|uniref:hypothetical protein n=1 Tax=Legionella pneumophila TaxID=446 RepID=UPI0004BA772E|nr:hypothetical protein [Legionella pneumophila]HCR5301657.1 hypothetical protein [Legionella pneumophila]HDU8249217.1 hypothetical protein [Legionella pneumophila]HDY2656212.1 hypothetical protein [Legionella pneumophila]